MGSIVERAFTPAVPFNAHAPALDLQEAPTPEKNRPIVNNMATKLSQDVRQRAVRLALVALLGVRPEAAIWISGS